MDIQVKPLSPELLADYLEYFDNVAFSDNPDWAGCYCYFYCCDPSEDFDSRTSGQNREAAAGLISRGEMHGYLAYMGDEVVGWCHASPRSSFPAFADDPDLTDTDPATTGSIVCFNVAPGRRRVGIATALLDAATRGLAGCGMTVAEAYPREDAATEAGHYHGPLELYLRAGFSIARRLEDCLVVRKNLANPLA
jgi:GNAT superfamily N-acetyltransferase